MKIVRGNTRTVLIFENFVVKFPQMHLRKTYKLLRMMPCYQWPLIWGNSIYSGDSIRRNLFRGIVVNWKEFSFYCSTQSLFLVPTYFSLFGLLNVQKRVKITKINSTNLWVQLSILTGDRLWCDSHSFDNSSNFGEEDGRLVMVDYGSPRIHDLLREYGDKIFKDFDLNYVSPASDDTTTG